MKKLFTIFGIIFFLYAVFSDPEPTSKQRTVTKEVSQIELSTESLSDPIVLDTVAKPVSGKVLYVTGSVVNLRAKATTNSRIVSKLSRGTKVHMTGSKNGKWIPILVDKLNVVGWMYGDFLKDTKPAVNTAPKQTTKKRSIAAPTSREVRDARKAIISQSIRSYPGSCPCPYNRDRAGRKCGGRSAWSRPGGYSPSCYASDVTEARLKTYFKRVKGITY